MLSAVAVLVWLTVGVAPIARADPSSPTAYATLGLTEVTPSTVTSSSGDTVTVRGRIVNTAGRSISDVDVRLQRGNAVTESYQLRSSLTSPSAQFGVTSSTTRVTGTLRAGKSVDFAITVPVSGAGGLGLTSSGVYPLMVDVTGTPHDSGTVSIADSRTLLPVLSLPADRARARDYVDPASGSPGVPLLGRDGSIAPNTTSPAAFTMIWPLAASPQEAAGVLGGGTSKLRLISDSLGHSLQPDGRLGMALQALESLAGVDGTASDQAPTTAGGPPSDDPVRDSVCLAVDPDLISTVKSMADGYAITEDPADPEAPTHDGQGAATAASWLHDLTQVASRMCVTALPYAQAGLDSLRTINDADLAKRAVLSPYDAVDALLGVKTVRGLTVPATGTLTSDGRDLLTELGVQSAAIASTSLVPLDADRAPDSGTPSGRYRSQGVRLQSYDVAVSAALGGAGLTPVVPAIMPNWQQPNLSSESAVSRRQTAAAALAFPMLDAPPAQPNGESGDADLPTTGRSSFVMPPTYWSPTVQDAQALRDTAALMLSSGTARPVPLSTVIDEMPAANATARLETPGDIQPDAAAGYPITQTDGETVRQRLDRIDHLQAALVGNADTVTTPAEYMAPLRDDLLRAVSSASTTDNSVARGQRDERLTAVGATLTNMQQGVSLLDPSGRYTLASERSPLLLVVRNTLALPIRVRLDIDAPSSLEVGDVGTVEIPAAGTRQLQIPTHATSSEPATVHISLVTSSDVPLSTPVELSVYANAYGKPLFWITIGAAAILILLTARRLWHRFRGEPDPADEDRPEPDEDDLEQATLSYQYRLAAERAAEEVFESDPAGETGRRDGAPNDGAPNSDGPTDSGASDSGERA
ncbi:DUF6049 family protein [Gordonia neofelifaecis]|uniref:Glycoprotein n=1 Tax=Gordonia neofelifaecis NRRL B-59395 TaxID=644548 RepID=F1YL79_9ACTN|nr:DUF6049 family protein [Gordonia neofelifaecis]EGD54539.1 hypothetical protein SCNU_13193 [Gordonia neofelifaecis NRRL B-59395]